MKQVAIVEAKTLKEYANEYNEVMSELSRFKVERVEQLSATSALIYYDTPDEVEQAAAHIYEPDFRAEIPHEKEEETQTITIELKVTSSKGRVCAECENYIWGQKCPYHEGHVRIMDDACAMFNINIGRFC